MSAEHEPRFDLNTAILNAGLTPKSFARRVEVGEHVVRALVGKVDRAVDPANAKIVADFFEVEVTDLIDPVSRKSRLLGAPA